MSVVGFDLGSQKSTIAVAKGGGIEIVLNEESDRFTPSCIGFGERLRLVGGQAKQHMRTHPQSSVINMKRMIGRPLSDPIVQREKPLLGCELVNGSSGEVAAKVNYLNEKHEFTMTQLVAMLLYRLKTSAENGVGIKSMKDCVISVPSYFSDTERQCLLNAAVIAGLNPLKLLNETTAVALCYGIFRTDFPADPAPDAAAAPASSSSLAAGLVGKSRLVAFVDVGHAASQFSIVAFNAGKLRVICSVHDVELGGRDFDSRLYNHFVEEIKKKFRLDVNSKKRAQVRLLTECERLKKLMSANTSKIPMNVDSLIEDRDITSSMNRADFEAMCDDLLIRVEQLAVSLLDKAGIQASEIDEVEIIGGSTRMPAIRERVKKVFGREPSTTINAEEAAARGCAIQCAILSPNFRVREFAVADCLQYPITIEWDKTSENEVNGMDIFTQSEKLPASKMLTLNKTAPFSISAYYTNPKDVPHPCKFLGKYMLRDVPGNASKVKVKVRINKNGIFQLAEATAYEKYVETVQEPVPAPEGTSDSKPEKEPMDQDNAQPRKEETKQESKDVDMDTKADASIDGVEAAPANGTTSSPRTQTTQKVKTRAHDLVFDFQNVPGMLSETALRDFIESENAIQSQNKQERDRVDAKNAVEEYVLNIHRELSESLQPYASAEEAKTLSEMCDTTNDWLYDEGEDQPKSVYSERLAQLTKIGDPIRRRHYEHQHRPAAFDQLGRTVMHYRKIVEAYKNKDDKYAHLDEKEMERVEKAVDEKQAWFDEKQGKQMGRKLYEDVAVYVDSIVKEAEFLAKLCDPIVTRPKPAPKPPTPPPAEKAPEPAKTEEAPKEQKAAEANGMELD